MHVLITGVNGFIGQYAAEIFVSNGIQVTGTGRQSSCSFPDIAYVQAELTDDAAVSQLIEAGPYDGVVHLAASIKSNTAEPLKVNALAAYNILRAASCTGCRFFQHLSSIPIIGVPPNKPITEDVDVKPVTAYHISKYAAEQVVMLPQFSAMKRYNFRIASPIGAGMPMHFLRIMLEAAQANLPLTLFGSGSRIQNYIDVRDIGSSLVKAAEREPESGVYLLGGNSYSNLEIARRCISITNGGRVVFLDKADPADGERWLVDDRKSRQAFGHDPQYSLDQTLMDMLM